MAAVYSVKHAAAMTGIPADTLRMWERRYHVVEPIRSEGGYRLYDDAAIARLSAMRALVAAGWSPRLAAEQVRSGTTAGPIADPPPAGATHPRRSKGSRSATSTPWSGSRRSSMSARCNGCWRRCSGVTTSSTSPTTG